MANSVGSFVAGAFTMFLLVMVLVLFGHIEIAQRDVEAAALEKELHQHQSATLAEKASQQETKNANARTDWPPEALKAEIIADANLVDPEEERWMTGKKWLLDRVGIVVACVNCDEVLANYQANTRQTLILRNIRDTASCSGTELSIFVRFKGPVYLAHEAVGVEGKCEWRIEFELSFAGDYHLEIRLMHWHGLHDWTGLLPCPDKMERGSRMKGDMLFARNHTLYDECSCHFWCARVAACTGSHFEKYTEHGGHRTCTLFTGKVSIYKTDEKSDFLLAGRMDLTPAERTSLPTFLGHQRNPLAIPINASTGTVYGSLYFRVHGPPKVFAPDRPQCREMKASHNVWKPHSCDHRGDHLAGASRIACRGVVYKEGLGKCYVVSEHDVGLEEGFYLEPEECEYRFFPPEEFLKCLVDLNATRVSLAGASLTGMLVWDMPKNDVIVPKHFSNGLIPDIKAHGVDVVIVNARMMHVLWHSGPLAQLKKEWKEVHLPFLDLINATHKFFLTAPSLMSEREPHDTFDRARWINKIIRQDLAVRPDWHVIPFGSMTLPVLVDRTCINDGMHSTSNIRRMVVQMVANVLCDARNYHTTSGV